MARIRTIKPEFFDDEDIARMSAFARLGFIGLWTEADRDGRLRDRPVRLKARIFPYDDLDMNALLNEMAQHKFITRYDVGGMALIQVRTFGKHQNVPPNETKSVLPGPQDVASPENGATVVQEYGREGNREQEGNGDSAVPLCDTTPALMTFPTVGRGPKLWDLTSTQVAEWQTAYPGIDVLGECRKALAWVKANQPKTWNGMPKFLVNWLNRATNAGRGQRPAVAPAVQQHADARGHLPPCRTRTECNERLEREIAARKAAAS